MRIFLAYQKILCAFLGIVLSTLALGENQMHVRPAAVVAQPKDVTLIAGVPDAGIFSYELVGGEFEYLVQKGDSLTSIGARLGVEPSTLARMNKIQGNSLLYPGKRLQIENRHIVPERLTDGLLINLPQRLLYYFESGTLIAHYPVGLGSWAWPTPTGSFNVLDIQENKVWYVPKSIQEEMRREGKPVRAQVPPGPENPLGKFWIGLSLPAIGIHGTNAPASVYHFQSHGCIRLHPDDIAALVQRVRKNMQGKIIYAPVLLARINDGRIFLEVNRDVYRKNNDPLSVVEHLARTQVLTAMIDWEKVRKIIQLKDGVAREVGLHTPVPLGETQ